MSKIIKINEEKFLKAQWDFYHPLGAIYKLISNNGFRRGNIEFVEKNALFKSINPENQEEILTFEDFKDYQLNVIKNIQEDSSITYNIAGYGSIKLDNQFMLEYLKNAPEDRFKIVTNHTDFFQYYHDAMNDYENVLSLIFNNLKLNQSLQYILNMSISDMEMTKGLLNNINQYIPIKTNKKTRDDFFYNFIKKRKNQIQTSSIKSYTRDFILKNVTDAQLLEKYNKFFPHLEEVGKYKDIDFFEESLENVFTIIINPKNMELKYEVLGYTSQKYVGLSKMIFECLNEQYKLNSYELVMVEPPKGTPNRIDAITYKCYISHNTNMTKEKYKKIFKEIIEKCINYSEDNINPELLKKLVETYKLDSTLPKSSLKQKISKL